MQLTELVTAASERAIASMEGAQVPLIPFTLLLRPGRKTDDLHLTVTKFASEFPEQSLEHAQASLRSNTGSLMYALASPSTVTINGRVWEAVLIECGTPEDEEGAIYAQCYEREKAGLFKKKLRILPFGEPFLVSKCASKLWSVENSGDDSLNDWHWVVGDLPEQRQPAA